MTIVTINTQLDLSALLARAEAGEEIVLARGDIPVARLVKMDVIAPVKKRTVGGYEGLIDIGPEFFEPLPEDELKHWDGN